MTGLLLRPGPTKVPSSPAFRTRAAMDCARDADRAEAGPRVRNACEEGSAGGPRDRERGGGGTGGDLWGGPLFKEENSARLVLQLCGVSTTRCWRGAGA